jgi:trigger factor
MQITVQRISPVLMELSVEVPADTVKAEVDKAYSNLARRAHVKGFRPGKAPRSVLTHLFGPQVQNDVASAIVNETLPKVLTEKNVTPVSQPSVDFGKVAANETFSYKARFEVQPDIGEVKYEGFEIVRPTALVPDSMVDEQIEALRLRHASLRAPEPARPARSGDVVTIDFTLSVDGNEIQDAGGQGVQIELGGGQALPELDAALAGKSPAEAFTVDSKFPDAHPKQELRGKTGHFSVTLVDVKEKILPSLDDEFAKDVGNFQTLIELRADVHTKLEKMLKDRADTALAEQVVEKLNELNPCEVPPSLVEQQCRIMEQEILMQARRLGQRITQEQAQGMHERVHADAEKKVRAGLLMAAIARKHEFKVTEEDIDKGLAELAAETGKNVAKLKAEYREKQKRDILIGMILEDKILDFIESKSKITDGPLPGAVESKGEAEGSEKGKKKKPEARGAADSPKGTHQEKEEK